MIQIKSTQGVVMLFGYLNLSFTGFVVSGLVLTQITIAAVTLYLHRHQTHRALDLHPVISHFFRFWLWMTTGMVTRDWVAIHRKHHATTDVVGDPHSPKVLGLKKVLWEGAELYRESAKDTDMIAQYSHGTPEDWVEKNIYQRHSGKGILLMLGLDLFLFGIPGLTIWALQMLWIPFHAAGVINGVGHHWGYRNFECPDAARNIFPWGFWVGGEELHNNHHTFASSAKFSVKWWEFDLGWLYIRLLSFFGLARVKKLPPKLAIDQSKKHIDIDTVKAVISNRFQVMVHYYKEVVRPTLRKDKSLTKGIFRPGRLLRLPEKLLTLRSKERLNELLSRCQQLNQVYQFKQSLQNVWLISAASQDELIQALKKWCHQAESSGVEVLEKFADRLKGYVPKTAK